VADVLVVGGIFREVLGRRDGNPEIRLAGSALTAAVAASRLGVSVALASFVGSEDVDSVNALLEHASVDGLLVVLDGASGTFAYEDAAAVQPRPLYRPAETCPTELPPLPEARVVLVFGVPDFDPVRDQAVSRAVGRSTIFLWDRQGWLSRTRDAKAAGALEAASRVLLINSGEAIDEGILDPLTGEICLPGGYARAVIKDGTHGVLVLETEGEYRRSLVPVFPVNASSTVGSGDLFGGVTAACLAAGNDLVYSARLAAAATSIVLASGDTFAPPDLSALALNTLNKSEGHLQWRWPLV